MDITPDPRLADAIRPSHIYPLEKLPDSIQERVGREVALPHPPAKWLNFGLFQMHSRAWWEWHWQRGIDPGKRREPISDYLRQRVYDRDGRACLRCGATERLSLDHIVHKSSGGPDTYGNLRTLCVPCNSSRRTKTDVEWLGADL